VTEDDVRALALGLPEVSEGPHHERTAFRVRGKIFATMPSDGASVNVLLDEEEARAAAAAGGAELLPWGRSIAGVRVDLAGADADLLAELLEDAWRRRAPKALVSEREAGR
jgi:hypothetical protein